MTIDERLERLVERHEALAQTVELLAHEVRQNTANIRDLAQIATQTTDAIRRSAAYRAVASAEAG